MAVTSGCAGLHRFRSEGGRSRLDVIHYRPRNATPSRTASYYKLLHGYIHTVLSPMRHAGASRGVEAKRIVVVWY